MFHGLTLEMCEQVCRMWLQQRLWRRQWWIGTWWAFRTPHRSLLVDSNGLFLQALAPMTSSDVTMVTALMPHTCVMAQSNAHTITACMCRKSFCCVTCVHVHATCRYVEGKYVTHVQLYTVHVQTVQSVLILLLSKLIHKSHLTFLVLWHEFPFNIVSDAPI